LKYFNMAKALTEKQRKQLKDDLKAEIVEELFSKIKTELFDPIQKQITVLSEKLERLGRNEDLQELTAKIDSLADSIRTRPSYGQPPSSPMSSENFAQLYKMFVDVPMIAQKPCSAVIVNLPESDNNNEEQTEAADQHFVEDIARQAGMSDSIRDIHRHGQKRDNRPRIVKVHLQDIHARNKFLRVFNSHRPKDGQLRFVYVRRDYTDFEQQRDRELRSECYRRNEAVGRRRFVVRDLEIIDKEGGADDGARADSVRVRPKDFPRGGGGFRGNMRGYTSIPRGQRGSLSSRQNGDF
jgi:hypothetical protein